MTRAVGPILKTILFTILVPGSVLVLIPQRILGGFPRPAAGPLTWLGGLIILLGASIYFRCAWEFAVRGLGTPAPIAPPKFLVTTALHRYVRNPMYIGVFLVLLGEAGLFLVRRCFWPMQPFSVCPSSCSSFTTKSPRSAASSANRTSNIAARCHAGFPNFVQHPAFSNQLCRVSSIRRLLLGRTEISKFQIQGRALRCSRLGFGPLHPSRKRSILVLAIFVAHGNSDLVSCLE